MADAPRAPLDEELRDRIDDVALQVAEKGREVEACFKGEQADNPLYSFLLETDPYHPYYLFQISFHEVRLSKKRGRKRKCDNPMRQQPQGHVDDQCRQNSSTCEGPDFPRQPDDEIQQKIIEGVVALVASGKELETDIKGKFKNDPRYSFLFGGQHSEYYQFLLSVEEVQASKQTRKGQTNPSCSKSSQESTPQPPVDEKQREILESFALRVVLEGANKEDEAKAKENENPVYAFLFGGSYFEYYEYYKSLMEFQMGRHRKNHMDFDKNKSGTFLFQRRVRGRTAQACSQHTSKQKSPSRRTEHTAGGEPQAPAYIEEIDMVVGALAFDCLAGHQPPHGEPDLTGNMEDRPAEVEPHPTGIMEDRLADVEPDPIGIMEEAPADIEATPTRVMEQYNQVPDDPEANNDAHQVNLEEDNNIIEDEEAIEPPPPPPPTFKQLQEKLQGEFGAQITQQPNATPAEVMHNMLLLSKEHNWSFTEQSHVMMLVNSLFKKPVVPDSRYLLDKYVNSSEGINYHFFCQKCFTPFYNIDIDTCKELFCQDCNVTIDISDLTKACFFVTFDLVIGLQNLLKNAKVREALKKFFVADKDSAQDGVMNDLYDGSIYKKFRCYIKKNRLNIADLKDLSLIMCTDGSPVFKSSNCSIWPLFFMISELPIKLRMQHLLLGGLWFGNTKPKMNLFFEPVVNHLKRLANPFSINVENTLWFMRMHMIGCCVDSGARGGVQGIHAHNGEAGCNWCLHPGIGMGPARYYPLLEVMPEERSIREILEDAVKTVESGRPVNGVLGISALTAAPLFDIVNGMVLDHLHNFNLGIARQFGKSWFGGHGADVPYYIGSPVNIEFMDARIKLLRPPTEMRKYQRAIGLHPHWSGLEWENWIMYFSVAVLEDILEDKFLRHWALFVQAVRLLLQSRVRHSDVNKANILMIQFVGNVLPLYGEGVDITNMTFNVHLLLHAAKSASLWGPKWAVSSYAFEAGNGELLRIVHANRGISHQICRAISHSNALHILGDACSDEKLLPFKQKIKSGQQRSKCLVIGNLKFLGNSFSFVPTDEEKWLLEQTGEDVQEYVCYEKVVLDGVVYAASSCKNRKRKTDNSFALTKKGNIVCIHCILLKENEQTSYVIVSQVRCSPHRFAVAMETCDVENAFLLNVDVIDIDKQIVSVEDLSGKYVSIDVGSGHYLSKVVYACNTC